MANAHKGDVSFDVAGKTYTLRFSVDALCQLEDQLGMGFPAIVLSMQNPKTLRLGTARAVLWAGLIEHHPDIDVKAAGELMVAGGGMMKVMPKIEEGFARAFPELEAEDKAHPRKPGRNGTGPESGRAGAASN